MNYNNLDFLKNGDLLLLDTKVNERIKPYFFIKDHLSNLAKIGQAPKVESKGIIFETETDRLMLLLMFRLNKDDGLIYCQWFNYHETI